MCINVEYVHLLEKKKHALSAEMQAISFTKQSTPLMRQSLTLSLGKRRYDRKQSGFGGQTKPIFHKKAKTTKKIVLRLECSECKSKHQIALKRCKHFELGGEKKSKVSNLSSAIVSMLQDLLMSIRRALCNFNQSLLNLLVCGPNLTRIHSISTSFMPCL